MEIMMYQSVKDIRVSKKWVQKVVQTLLKSLKQSSKITVSIHFIGDKRMKTLNRSHRGKNKTTDVLSFSLEETSGFATPAQAHDIGDIFISVPQIIRQAKEYRVSYKEECGRMLIHGVLHLLGYDHEKKKDAKKMFGIQERILTQVTI